MRVKCGVRTRQHGFSPTLGIIVIIFKKVTFFFIAFYLRWDNENYIAELINAFYGFTVKAWVMASANWVASMFFGVIIICVHEEPTVV